MSAPGAGQFQTHPVMDYEAPGTGQAYREARALSEEAVSVWTSAIRDMIPPGPLRSVVDVGAGTGRFSALLADVFGVPVIAVEPSSSMSAERSGDRQVQWLRGVVEALPVRTAAVDLVFLSMVYHHFASPAAALAELARVLRPGGHVMMRTVTLETLEGLEWRRCFPEAMAIDAALIPRRETVTREFAQAGFGLKNRRTVEHPFAADYAEYYAKISHRGLSCLRLLPDAVFTARLAEFEAYCRTASPDRPIVEPVEVFVFQRGPAP